MSKIVTKYSSIFLSTPSARRATNKRLIEELEAIFLSTPSARRATVPSIQLYHQRHNFYPRPPRGGRPLKGRNLQWLKVISIHALREEGDPPKSAAFVR